MGESAVLLRSFSHPSDASLDAREGDPILALTESISFGRFMSESLAWEKWSTFSHNRYLEEVEKFSKPGSVAEKKAYFEAHYKRKAAMKAAAAKEANAAANDVPELKTTSEILNNSPMDTEIEKTSRHLAINQQKEQCMANTSNDSPMDIESTDMSHVVTDEQWKEDSPDTKGAHFADANACCSINIRDELEDADIERGEAIIGNDGNVENRTGDDNLKQLQNPDVDKKINASPVERMNDKAKDVDKENSASPSNKKHSSYLPKSSYRSGVSRLASYSAKQVPSLPARNVENIAISSEESVGDSNKIKKVVPKFLHKSINFSPRVSETSKASLKPRKDSSTPIRTPTRASVNGVSKHLSRLFQSEDKRSKTLVSKSFSGGITEDDGQSQSLTVVGSKSSSANGKKARYACISSHFIFRSEERAAKRKEARMDTSFFEKLEEKDNAKEAEKGQPVTRSKEKVEQNSKKLRQSTSFKVKQNEYLYRGSHLPSDHMKKEKVENDIEKLGQNTCFKAKPNENSLHGLPSPSNHMKKKPLSQPWSPKLGRQSTPTSVQGTSSRPPRRPSVNTETSKHVLEKNKPSTTCSVTSLTKLGRNPTSNPVQDSNVRPPWRSSINTASFKHAIEKNNISTNRSVTSLTKKNAHENASPNIQH